MRVALYARVSTEEQALHGLSIEAQLAALREAYPNGQEYVDLGISARKAITKRPELQRLLRDVEEDRIDLIVFTKLDRWTRNVREYYKCQDILDAHHVAWRALHENYETETASGRFVVSVMLAVAEQEADRTSERIKAVFEHKRNMGLRPAGAVALGLKLEDGKIVAGDEAQEVRDIFSTYIATRSTNATAKAFNKPPTTLKYLLTNEQYLKSGVIDSDTWRTVQDIHMERETRSVRTDRVYLFSGLIYCPYCGHRLTSTTATGIIYYRCPNRYAGRCKGIYVRESKVEEYLLSNLMSEVDNVNLTIREKQTKKVDISALKKKRDRLTDLYMTDLIDRDKYETDFKTLTAQIDQAEREPKPLDTEEVMTVLEAYQSLSRRAKKAFWSNLIKSITPKEDGYFFTVNSTN